jgi:hypothetical protein
VLVVEALAPLLLELLAIHALVVGLGHARR